MNEVVKAIADAALSQKNDAAVTVWLIINVSKLEEQPETFGLYLRTSYLVSPFAPFHLLLTDLCDNVAIRTRRLDNSAITFTTD